MKIKKKFLLLSMALVFTVATLAQAIEDDKKPVSLDADQIEYNSTTGNAVATGNVYITREDGFAKSNKAEYNVKSELGYLWGGVHVKRLDTEIVCEILSLNPERHFIADGGNVVITKATQSLNAARVEYWELKEYMETFGSWAVLSDQDGSTMKSKKIIYDLAKGQAYANEDVRIDSPVRKLVAEGDNATYIEAKEDVDASFILTGNAWAIQDGNKITGNKLTFRTDKQDGEAEGKVVFVMPPRPEEVAKPIQVEKSVEKTEKNKVTENKDQKK